MPYIGRGPGFGIRQKYFFTATAGQTSISGSDDNGLSLAFTDGLFVDVYLNGVLLDPNTDYNTTTANTVAGLSALSLNDFVEIVAYDSFTVGDVVPASTGGTFSGAVTVNNNITSLATVTGVAGTFSGDITSGGNAVKVAGKESMWIPSLAMNPTVTNGCAAHVAVETTSGRPDMIVLDFDKDSDEFAQFSICFPKSWNEGTITYQAYWSGLAATTGVAWSLDAVAISDNETIDVAFGTPVVVQDDAQGAVEEICASAESSAVTIAGSPAAGDLVFFRIGRDVSDSNDDMAGDARLHGVKIFFTTDAANDA